MSDWLGTVGRLASFALERPIAAGWLQVSYST